MESLAKFIIIVDLFSFAIGSPWIVTRYFESNYQQVTPTVEDPVAFSTVADPHYDVTHVDIYLEPSQGRPYDPLFDYTGPDYAYYFGLTYSWPESCTKNHGAFTTDIRVPVPREARQGLTPISIVPVEYRHPEGHPLPTENAYLDPTDVPTQFVSQMRDHLAPYIRRNCNAPWSTDKYDSDCDRYFHGNWDNPYGGGYCCDDECHHTWGFTPGTLAVTVILSWIGGIFLMGLIQSAVQFRALMVGKGARRGLPTMFLLLIPIVMLVLHKCMRTRYEARGSHDQTDLRKQWDAIPFWKKVSLWLRYGFTTDYPPMLGSPPQKVTSRAPLLVSPPPPYHTVVPSQGASEVELTEQSRPPV